MKRFHALKHEAGFTIIEVMVAIFVLLLGVLATTTLLNTANAETSRNQARNGATNLVRDIIEAARALPYDQVNPTKDSSGNADDTLITGLQAMAPTGNNNGSSFSDSDTAKTGWQITRRNFEYNVTVQACVVDDAKDNVVSPHTPAASDGSGYYCPDLPTSPTGDTNGDDYRRVKVIAAWTSNSCNSCSTPGAANSTQQFSVSQTGVIINPTGGLGPAPIGPIQNPTTVACPNFSKTYTQTFDKTATGAVFSVNDPANTSFTATIPTSVDATSGAKTYTFTYSPNPTPPDSFDYQVTAQGFNSQQQFGRISVGTAYINCHEPPAVQNVNGGFDWRRCTVYPATCGNGERIFDLDWNPSGDADVVGYYVYRVNGDADWSPTRASGDAADTKVSCISLSKLSQNPQPTPVTTTMPGPLDFLEPFQPACWDEGVAGQPSLGTIVNPILFPGTEAKYWIQAVDPDPNVDPNGPSGLVPRPNPTNHSDTIDVTENMLNVPPTSPVVSVRNDNGQPCLSWTDSTDRDFTGGSADPIRFYRIYRDANVVVTIPVTYWNGDANVSANVSDVPYSDRIGRAAPNAGSSCDTSNPTHSWFKDSTAGSSDWHYWVTAVDQNYLESFASNTVNWSPPGS